MGARSNFGNMFSVIGASAWLPFVPMAAVQAIRQQSPSSIVVATPVASDSACLAVRQIADVCITLLMPEPLYGIGMYYADFSQTTDDEVLTLLQHTVHQPAQSVAS